VQQSSGAGEGQIRLTAASVPKSSRHSGRPACTSPDRVQRFQRRLPRTEAVRFATRGAAGGMAAVEGRKPNGINTMPAD